MECGAAGSIVPPAGSPGATKAADWLRHNVQHGAAHSLLGNSGLTPHCPSPLPGPPHAATHSPLLPPDTTAVRRSPLQLGWLCHPPTSLLHPDTRGMGRGGAVTCLEPALRWFSPALGPPCTSVCHRSTSTGHRCCPHPVAPRGGCRRPSPVLTRRPPPDGDMLKSSHIVTQNMMTPLCKHLPPSIPSHHATAAVQLLLWVELGKCTPRGRQHSLSVQGGI